MCARDAALLKLGGRYFRRRRKSGDCGCTPVRGELVPLKGGGVEERRL